MGGKKEILGAALLAIRALAANPVDDVVALAVLTTHQIEVKAAFFDTQLIPLGRPEKVKRPTNGNGKGELPSKGEIFPGHDRRTTNHQVLPNRPQEFPLRL